MLHENHNSYNTVILVLDQPYMLWLSSNVVTVQPVNTLYVSWRLLSMVSV